MSDDCHMSGWLVILYYWALSVCNALTCLENFRGNDHWRRKVFQYSCVDDAFTWWAYIMPREWLDYLENLRRPCSVSGKVTIISSSAPQLQQSAMHPSTKESGCRYLNWALVTPHWNELEQMNRWWEAHNDYELLGGITTVQLTQHATQSALN